MRFIVFLASFVSIILFSTSLQESYQGIVSNILSIAFVFGGTLVATLISYPVEKMKNIKQVLHRAYSTSAFDYPMHANFMVHTAREYKRIGFKSLESASEAIDNQYVKLGLQLIADNCSWEHIKSTLEKEFIFDSLETDSAQRIIRSMARYAPSFGLAGTIIGLMKIFPQLANPANIGGPMSLALLTTLYGVLASNLIFMPIANKLKDNTTDDEVMFRFILEGLQCIQEREYSVITEQRLSALMPKHELLKYKREKVDDVHLKLAANG